MPRMLSWIMGFGLLGWMVVIALIVLGLAAVIRLISRG
jgi:hypothetical protein